MVDHGGATTIGRFPCAVYSENNLSITVVLQQDLQQSHPGAGTRDTFEQYFAATSIAVPCAHRIQKHGGALRDAVFRPGTLHPRGFEGARARGRPRQTWTSGVLREALEAAGGSQEHLSFLLQDTPGCRRAWGNAISKHCNKAAEGSK